MSPITVAIAGGTGQLGLAVTRAFLSPTFNPSRVKRVVVFTRQPTSDIAKELQAQGAEIYDSNITTKALEGVDAVVNVLGMTASKEVNDNVAKTAAEAGVRVYIPNEFGMDLKPLGSYGKPYAIKNIMSTYARELNGGSMKVISIYTAAFLEVLFLMANGVFNLFGDPANKFSYTSMRDIGLSVASMVVLSAQDPASVPDYVRLSGGAISWVGLAELIEKERGGKVTVNIGDINILQEKIEKEDDRLSAGRYAFATGAADYSENNFNELVNPGESLWKWDTIEEYVHRTQGLPTVGRD
ncbi:hypothetical protein M407DRAFT_218886 [Tulasnella calospora MUT 4182]|uniref:NmrA-like domain-containing protein n=1 Tax=Tulasnella calospora MUT 4182 TaxID=1051891 RepID=A0A0C3LCQ1_9AGAM|nr:hypothetical protein M407DRAFT_218886 [Tulasnella calospora MUT 4182]